MALNQYKGGRYLIVFMAYSWPSEWVSEWVNDIIRNYFEVAIIRCRCILLIVKSMKLLLTTTAIIDLDLVQMVIVHLKLTEDLVVFLWLPF